MKQSDRRSPEKGIAVFWVKGIVEAFAAEGLDPDGLLRAAGIEPAALADVDGRVPIDAVSRLWQAAVTRSGSPLIGLGACLQPRPASFGIVAYAMMTARDLGGLLDRIQRYVHLINDTARITLVQNDQGVRLVLTIPSDAAPWQEVAFAQLTFLSFCRWVMLRDLRPVSLHLAFPAPKAVSTGLDMFAFPWRFDATENALVFSKADAALPLPTAHPQMAEVTERLVRERLRALQEGATSRRVKALIGERLSEGEPSRATIAAELGASPRTLHRRLAEEGTSFREIVDDTRRDLAKALVERPEVSLADAAFLLGFRDQSGFFRAYRRWFGRSPRGERRLSGG